MATRRFQYERSHESASLISRYCRWRVVKIAPLHPTPCLHQHTEHLSSLQHGRPPFVQPFTIAQEFVLWGVPDCMTHANLKEAQCPNNATLSLMSVVS